jgi:hypothetical protein
MWVSLGSNEWPVTGVLNRGHLWMRTNSHCVRFKDTVHGCFGWNRDRTASAPHLVITTMNGTVLPAAVAMDSTMTGWDAVDVKLTVTADAPLHTIGPSAQTTANALSYMACNEMHVSVLGMRPPAVILRRLGHGPGGYA